MDKKDPARFTLSFSFEIAEQVSSYETTRRVQCSITERLPVGVDPQQYLRKRLSEEVARQFVNLKQPIDNAPEADPLTQE